MTPVLSIPTLEYEPLLSDLFFFSNIQIAVGDLKIFRRAISALADDLTIVMPAALEVIDKAVVDLSRGPRRQV